MRLLPQQQAPDFTTQDIHANRVALSDYKDKQLMLCFFRYAGCPFCSVAMLKLIRVYPELNSLGLHMLFFFQSPTPSVIQYVEKFNPPVPIIADPDKKIYSLYGIESSFLGWPNSLIEVPHVLGGMLLHKVVQGKIDGDPNLLPADFLIGPPNFTIHSAYYSSNFMERMPVSEIKNFLKKKSFYNG